MTVWRRIVSVSEDVEKVTKPLILILATLGILAVYFPSMRRGWEHLTLKESWYQVGVLKRSSVIDNYSQFSPNSYDSAAWNGGRLRLDDLYGLIGHTVLTNDTAVGRQKADVNSEPLELVDKNSCLYVRWLAFAPYRPGDKAITAIKFDQLRGNEWATKHSDLIRRTSALDSPSCQLLTSEEQSQALIRKSSAQSSKSNQDARQVLKAPTPQVCARIQVWVHAQKVSC